MMNDLETQELFEAYPHIANRVQVLWGSDGCRKLLMSLIGDSRDGDRGGFDPKHAKIIFKLISHHDKEFPEFDTSHDNPVPFIVTRINRKAPEPDKYEWSFLDIMFKALIFVFVLGIIHSLLKQILPVLPECRVRSSKPDEVGSTPTAGTKILFRQLSDRATASNTDLVVGLIPTRNTKIKELQQLKDFWDDDYRDETIGNVLNRAAWLVKEKTK